MEALKSVDGISMTVGKKQTEGILGHKQRQKKNL